MEIHYLRPIDGEVVRETKAVRYEPFGTCPANPKHRTLGRRLTPLAIALKDEPQDFMTTNGWPSACIVSDRVRAIFAEHCVTGFELLQVETRYTAKRSGKQRVPPRMWELLVTGWGGVAPPESGVVRLPEHNCAGCGMLRYSAITDASRFVDERQWDGSDVFLVWPSPHRFFLSSRVAEIIRRHGFTGCVLRGLRELAEEARGPVLRLGFGPLRLSRYMPAERAKLLGAEHDID
jgi:hypothetical protein